MQTQTWLQWRTLHLEVLELGDCEVLQLASSSFVPGFYRALNARSSADSSLAVSLSEHSNLTLPRNDDTGDADLPSDCFLVERVISARGQKVVKSNITVHNAKFIYLCRENVNT